MATDSQITNEKYDSDSYPFQRESYELIGICMEVHRVLGRGLLEIVYKDAIEIELLNHEIPFEREKKYEVEYKGHKLKHHFFADFVVFDKIILEVKAQKSIVGEHFSWVLNYLAISGCPLGLIVNFGEKPLKTKRLIL